MSSYNKGQQRKFPILNKHLERKKLKEITKSSFFGRNFFFRSAFQPFIEYDDNKGKKMLE